MTVVGHSQGGLIIHAYLNYMIEEGWGEQLEHFRQVITLAMIGDDGPVSVRAPLLCLNHFVR